MPIPPKKIKPGALRPQKLTRVLLRLGMVMSLVSLSVGYAAATDTARFTVSTSKTPLVSGSTGNQTITITNVGPSAATGVVATYTPPTTAGITVNSVSASPGGSCALTSGKWVCPSVASVALNGTMTLTVNMTVAPEVPAGTTAGSTTTVNSNEFNPGSGMGESLYNIWGAAGTSAAAGDAFWFAFDGKYDNTGNKVEGANNDITVAWPPAQTNPPGAYNLKPDTTTISFYTDSTQSGFSSPYGTTVPTTRPGPKVQTVVNSSPSTSLDQIVVNGSAANQARDNRRVWEIRTGIYLNSSAPLYVCVGQPDDGMYVAIDNAVVAQTNVWNSAVVNSSGATYAAGYHEIIYRIVNRNDQKDSWEGGAGGFASLGIGSTAASCTPSSYNTFTQVAPATNLTVGTVSISGTVYEDYNYGGGTGRAFNTAQGMSARPNARVELYNKSTGAFVASTTTDSSGAYTFPGRSSGNYTVRVVNSTVTSSRTGYLAGLLPVQTYTNGNRAKVGGEAPIKADAGANTTSAAYSTLNTSTTAAQSIADITVGSSNVTGVDFGFNFDTVVNTNETGQGSLRQFILNSNALGGEGSLAQAGSRQSFGAAQALPAGLETSIFMIPSAQLTGNVAQINVASLLAVTGPYTSIDGTTQSQNIGNTNTGNLGAGGTVGVVAATLPTVPAPEVQLRPQTAGSLPTAVTLAASNVQFRGLSVYGFGQSSSRDSAAALEVDGTYATGTAAGSRDNVIIEQNVFGTPAGSFTDPGASARSLGVLVGLRGPSTQGVVQNNLIGYSPSSGLVTFTSTNSVAPSNWRLQENEVRGNALANSSADGFTLDYATSTFTVRRNLITGNNGSGVDTWRSTGTHSILENTIMGNGLNVASQANAEISGVRLGSSSNTVYRNIVQDNAGPGVLVIPNYTGSLSVPTQNRISQNSFLGNGSNAIDLVDAANTATNYQAAGDGITLNDSNCAKTGSGNLGLDFPVISSALQNGNVLTITGTTCASGTVEVYLAASGAGDTSSSTNLTYGEGQTYLGALSVGGGNFTGTLNTALASGKSITTILIDGSNNTSEFNNVTAVVAAQPDLTITKTGPAYAKPSIAAQPTATPPVVESLQSITYTLKVSNLSTATASSSGTVTVTDTLPAGLTATAMGGTGWNCTLGTLSCTRSDVLAPGDSSPDLTVTVQAPFDTALENNAALRNFTNTAAVSGGGDGNSSNNSAAASTKMVYAKLVKSTRNVTRNSSFDVKSSGLPGEILEYCIAFTNYGGAALDTFVINDSVPANTSALATGYDADEPSNATGFGVKLTRGGVSYYTSAADADQDSLSSTGGNFGSGLLTTTLGTLNVGETGTTCFRVTIK